MKIVKIATIRGKTAEAIKEALKDYGILEYRARNEKGRKVLYVYTHEN